MTTGLVDAETTPLPVPDAAFSVPARLVRMKTRAQFLAAAKGASLARGAAAVQRRVRSDGDTAIGVGITATKKVGGAVVRNRCKRRLREAARALLPLHGQPGCDYVFVARAGTADRDWSRLLDDVRSALTALNAGGDEPRPVRKPRDRSARSSPRSPDTAKGPSGSNAADG
jgi:ribonuclease P protein component